LRAPGERFTKSQRLTQRRDFALVLGSAQRAQTKHFRVYVKAASQPRARLGIVVSKRIVRHAVARNRIKRLIREVYRREQSSIAPMDIVVLARAVVQGDQNSAVGELTGLLQKLPRMQEHT
jgi:ribonuclease P protein component